ncbi:hypothetical protein C9994_12640 [Marivirga lumbricoides]|uniref:Uncharacterized protein n=1 Tax=Marivirga lumbricoides TaxID=1046115 RepID=A0A2T4DJA2_9BACT|nr:hypothetical protein C9994_12640 [Marivirga lumbricoides]
MLIIFSCENEKHSGNKEYQSQQVTKEVINDVAEERPRQISCYFDNYSWQKEIVEKKTKSIKDYFLLLPMDIVNCEPLFSEESLESRKQFITKENIKNGYLEAEGMQLALFKDRNKNIDIIAVQRGKSGIGTTCGGVNTLLQFDEEKKCWIYRNDLLPEDKKLEEIQEDYISRNNYEMALPYYILPEVGTTIKVFDEENESTIYNLKWDGSKFSVETI